MGWQPHYTGIETREFRLGRVSLYLRRNKGGRAIQFARLNFGRRHFGAFLGETNYGHHFVGTRRGGFELWTDGFHLGFLPKKVGPMRKTPNYSGSQKDPWHSVTHRRGRFFLGWRQSEAAKAGLLAEEQRRWEDMAEHLEEIERLDDHCPWCDEHHDDCVCQPV